MNFGSSPIRLLIVGTVLITALGCVSKSKYLAQVSEKDALAERLKQEQALTAGLQARLNEALDRAAATEEELGQRLDQAQSELETARQAGSAQQQEFQNRVSDLEQQLAASREMSMKARRELEERTRAQNELINSLQKEIQEGNIKISQVRDQLSMQIVDKILFPSGSDEIVPEGKEVLKKVSQALKSIQKNRIRIEGHTDNVPIGSKLASKFPSNWELSTARASRVVRYLEELGVNPEKMSAVGMSQYRPIASNDAPEGRQQNRRIEIVLFPEDIKTIVEKLK